MKLKNELEMNQISGPGLFRRECQQRTGETGGHSTGERNAFYFSDA